MYAVFIKLLYNQDLDHCRHIKYLARNEWKNNVNLLDSFIALSVMCWLVWLWLLDRGVSWSASSEDGATWNCARVLRSPAPACGSPAWTRATEASSSRGKWWGSVTQWNRCGLWESGICESETSAGQPLWSQQDLELGKGWGPRNESPERSAVGWLELLQMMTKCRCCQNIYRSLLLKHRNCSVVVLQLFLIGFTVLMLM